MKWNDTTFFAVIGSLLLSAGCARIGRFAERKANEAAYGIVDGAQKAALGHSDPFSIDEDNELVDKLIEDADATVDIVSLGDALSIAVANSRSYQEEKESLFIRALQLSTVLKEYKWVDFSASGTAETTLSTKEDGTRETFGDNGIDLESTAKATTKVLASGATVTLSLVQDLLKYSTNPDKSSESSSASFKIVQPLLNGFGPLVSREPLRQAERSMVYEVRKFRRYQQKFVIDISSEYYALLKGYDQMENERKNYESAVKNRKQSEAFAESGRIPEFEVAQSRQRELTAADRWASSQADYEKKLDDFRYTLALPVELPVEPDPAEFDLLETRGMVELNIDFDEALAYAVSNRMDLVNQREQVVDKERKVKIALRNFMPNLDVTYDATKLLNSSSTNNPADISQNLTVELNLPLDWTERRNEYRIAQIELDQERRKLKALESDVRRNVRDLWRQLALARSVYKNRLLSVQLAERQVENTTLLLNMGRAQTRDQLEAQDDLLSARNDVTTALVDYTITRLRFWNAIERFEIDPKGMWYEQADKTME